ncbi:MAG: nitrate reductase [Halioglobus sp.]
MPRCKTTCPYCGVGCGIEAELVKTGSGSQVVQVSGDRQHPANTGRLCVKGSALAETLATQGRLQQPRHQGEALAWDAALDLVASKLNETRNAYGPSSIAFYLSGQLLTEDYYVANKLMKGFLGSGNVDTNSRLCMSSAVVAYQRAFGEDVVPCSYTDLEECDLLVMVGSNAAWTHPVIYQRIAASRQANPDKRIVVIDTRRTATCDMADLFLQIRPGSDAALFGGLLHYLSQEDAIDQDYVNAQTTGLHATLQACAHLDTAAVCAATGVDAQTLQTFYAWFLATAATVTLYSQGVNQSATGTDNCNAIINCHLATGRLGKPGAGPFSITGQPNAMGGREVGGLATQLAAHRGFQPADIDAVGRFWGSSDVATEPGLKAVDMFRAAARGEVRFLWIMATNPVVSLPDSALVADALDICEFVVVSDCTADTDTAERADLLLPAAGWGEKSGTVTNSERVISRQRCLVDPPGQARPDWWIVSEVARRLGFAEAFDYAGPAAIFREHAALSGFENPGSRLFDISALQDISDAGYDTLPPQRWPLPNRETREPFSDGRFSTPTGLANFVPVHPVLPDADGKLVVNSGRLRDHWHSMTRTGQVPRLSRHRDFFSISVSPCDARTYGLAEGQLVRLDNSQGSVIGPLALDPDLPDGQVWIPIHWSSHFASNGRANNLVASITDPHSGQPQSKFAAAALQTEPTACWGLLFSRQPLIAPALTYWSRITVEGGFLTLLAHCQPAEQTLQVLSESTQQPHSQQVHYRDSGSSDLRALSVKDGRVESALFLAEHRAELPAVSWMSTLGTFDDNDAPYRLLAGCNPAAQNSGALVCSCWEVGDAQIQTAIAAGADSVESLGERLRCGTRCGSCVPELKRILRTASTERVA